MNKKAANGDGSIRKRSNGLWEARFIINGQRKSVYGKTQKDVAQKKREALSAADQGQYIDPSKQTVGQWLRQWAEIYGRPTWRDTTASTHYQSIENHLLPAFGGILLQKLAAEDIQNFIIQQQKAGAEPATISKQLSPLKTALRQAVTLKKISRTPFEGVRLPKQIQAEVEHLNEVEQLAYVSALPDTTTGRLLRFILATGLRIGEAIGLRWEDVEAQQFTVRRTIATVSNFDRTEGEARTRQAVQPTKTGAGLRVIPLGPDMRQLLSRQRIAQAEERLKAGERWEDQGYCFASAIGTPLQVRNVRRTHNKTLELSGVTRVTLHGLRHSFATRWLSLDNDIRGLSEILGHADVATTLRRYVHSDPTHKADMMKRMEVL